MNHSRTELVQLMGSLHRGGVSSCLRAQRRLKILEALTDEWQLAGKVALAAGLPKFTTVEMLSAMAEVGDCAQRLVRAGHGHRVYVYRRL